MQLLPAVLLATVSGLLLAPYVCLPQPAGWLLAVVSLGGALICRRQRQRHMLLLLFFFLTAHLRYPLAFPDTSYLEQLESAGTEIFLTGVVDSSRQYADGRTSLDLQVRGLADRHGPVSIPGAPLVRLYLEQGSDSYLPGDRLRYTGRIRLPRRFGIPGEFNWPRHLACQGIVATLWQKNGERLELLGHERLFPEWSVAKFRRQVAQVISAAMPAARANLVRALVLGESRMLSDELRRQLARGGVSHLFAISGMHLGLLALFGYRLLLLAYRRSCRLLRWQPPQRVLPLILLPLLLTYLLLTGDAVATRRAFCLAVLGGGLLVMRRQVNPLQLLMSLALLFLLVNPLLLWEPSWQLSFAGAAGILLWRPLWQHSAIKTPPAVRFCLGLLLVTGAATLATLPLVLVNFKLFAPVGLLANLFCVPLVAFLALPTGLLGLLLFPLSIPLAVHAFVLCGWLLELVTTLVNKMVALPGMAGSYQFLSPSEYLAIALLLLPFICWPALGVDSKQFRRLTALALTFAGLLWLNPFHSRPYSQLTMFSVGQGESMLLTNATGQSLLVDGGGLYSEHFDVGERLLAPALGYLGVKQLDAVLLTHNHPDHRKGLIFVLREFPVKEFWSGRPLAELPTELQAVLLEKGISLRLIEPGWTEMTGWNQGRMRLFSLADRAANENDRSLVLHWQQLGQGVLLPGDLQAAGVDALLENGPLGPVSLLKLPHHGSRHSHSDKLIVQTDPDFCLVSAGYRNIYRLPAKEVTSVLDQHDIPLFRTDLQGSLQATLSDQGWVVVPWAEGLFH